MLALAEFPAWYWVGFIVAVTIFIAVDLGLFHRQAHVVGFKEALIWTAVWGALAVVFAAALSVLRGRKDFWAFSGENDRTYETTVRDLRRLDVVRRGRKVSFTFEADGFLYKMVRSLTGALVNVGLGKLTAAEIASLLKTRRRIATVVTAPPQGLFLVKVIY